MQDDILIIHLLNQASSLLAKHSVSLGQGTYDFEQEVAQLLSFVLKRELFERDLETKVSPLQARQFQQLLKERIEKRIPVAYLTGEAFFCNKKFYVTSDTLIPRSPIGYFIENLIEGFYPHKPKKILELCTGGGSLAIVTALCYPDAKVVASDICAQALQVAQQNANLHGVEVDWQISDFYDQISSDCFDWIIANPPYVQAEHLQLLPAEFHHEPPKALLDEQGIGFAKKIIAKAPQFLSEKGILILEVGQSASIFYEWLGPLSDRVLEVDFDDPSIEGVFLLDRQTILDIHCFNQSEVLLH